MKNTFLIFLAAAACFGCNNTTTTTTTTTFDSTTTIVNAPNSRHELFVLDSVLKQYETPMQRFKASIVSPTKITGAKGTIISVNSADLETVSGKPLGNHIDIELKELTTTEELARDRAATVSDGKLLVSGGAYYINMTSGGEQLRLKTGKTLAVRYRRNVKGNIPLLLGHVDSVGQLVWTDGMKTLDTCEINSDRLAVGDRTMILDVDILYNYTTLEKFGWAICGQFIEGITTTLTVGIDKTDSINYVAAYLVFKDINCVMQSYFEPSRQQCTFSNIPTGAKAALIAIGIKNGKMFTSKSKIVITENRKVPVKLKETPDNEVANLFKLN